MSRCFYVIEVWNSLSLPGNSAKIFDGAGHGLEYAFFNNGDLYGTGNREKILG